MKSHWWFIFGVLFFVGIGVTSVIINEKERNTCDSVIFLEGELGMDIMDVNYSNYGTVCKIKLCDGTTMVVPTNRIVKIVEK